MYKTHIFINKKEVKICLNLFNKYNNNFWIKAIILHARLKPFFSMFHFTKSLKLKTRLFKCVHYMMTLIFLEYITKPRMLFIRGFFYFLYAVYIRAVWFCPVRFNTFIISGLLLL